MHPAESAAKAWRRLPLIVLAATTLLAAQNSLAFALIDRPLPFGQLWLCELPLWLGWGLCAPVVHALTRRATAWSMLARALAHLGLAPCCYVLVFALSSSARAWLDPLASARPLAFDFVRGAGTHALIYAALAAASLARERADASARARALELELARAREQQLRARLRPHFLFNTLNTITALVHAGDPRAAVEVIADLATLLRRSLDAALGDGFLDDELDFCLRYLAIQSRRFGARLRVETQIEPGTGALLIPPMLLQPLVENVIVHAVATTPGPVTLELRAGLLEPNTASPRLRIELLDDGPGRPPDAREGIGLGSVRARLALRYGDEAELRLLPRAPGSPRPGLHVQLELPAAPR